MRSKLAKMLNMGGRALSTQWQAGGQNKHTALFIWTGAGPQTPKHMNFSVLLLSTWKYEGREKDTNPSEPLQVSVNLSWVFVHVCMSVPAISISGQTDSFELRLQKQGTESSFSTSQYQNEPWHHAGGFALHSCKIPHYSKAVTDRHPVDGIIISSSLTLQPQKAQRPLVLNMCRLREHLLHAAVAEFPTVVFGSGFEPHVASKLSAPSDVVRVLITHFCLKCFQFAQISGWHSQQSKP